MRQLLALLPAALYLALTPASAQAVSSPPGGITAADAYQQAQLAISNQLSTPFDMPAGSTIGGLSLDTVTARNAALSTFSPSIQSTTRAGLPSCISALYGQERYVTDLGGGPGKVACINGYWTPELDGVPMVSTATGVTTADSLATSKIVVLNPSGAFAIGAGVNITNPIPGVKFYIKVPATLGGLISSLGLSVAGSATGLTLLAGQTAIIVVNADLSVTRIQ